MGRYQDMETTSAARTSSSFNHHDLLVSNRSSAGLAGQEPAGPWCYLRTQH
jgi:hypothetical protein